MLAGIMTIATLAIAGANAAPAPDPTAGKAIFARCGICHTVAPGVNKLGPSLGGVVGRKAGTEAGYTYTPAMKNSGLTWTPATLDVYLTNPRAKVPGTKMIFAGLPNPTDRANVIAYLTNPAATK